MTIQKNFFFGVGIFMIFCSIFIFSAETSFAQKGGKTKPQVAFQANYAQITEGQPLRLSWFAQGGQNILCIAGGGWAGNKSTSDTETLYPKASLTYVLSCKGSNNSATTSQTVFVEVIKTNPSPIRAFPGAEGFGAYTPGGRGGRTIEVTNLNDSGPGSFRDAVSTTGPRIVVFRTAGTINVCPVGGGSIWVGGPYITIAGQTAPGDGITLRLDPTCNSTNPTVLGINTHDVVIRHIRIRAGRPGISTSTGAAINLAQNAYNVVLDHLSLSWSTDQLLGISRGAHDVTVQWSILSEPLNHNFTGDAYALLVSDDPGFIGTGNISVHHNLLAHNHHRNPQVTISGVIDIVNNVIYNFIEDGIRIWTVDNKPARANIINNYTKTGPSAETPTQELVVRHHNSLLNAPPFVFVQGNIGPKRPSNSLPHTDSITCLKDSVPCANNTYASPTRFNTPVVTTSGAATAFNNVLASAGARATITNGRDAVDNRVVSEVQNTTGRVIDNPSEVGGWPTLSAGIPIIDTDHDGMPDTWELLNSFNINLLDQNLDADNDGYKNIEEFLNGTNPRLAEAVYFPAVAYGNDATQVAQANNNNDDTLRKDYLFILVLVLLLSLALIYKVRAAKESAR